MTDSPFFGLCLCIGSYLLGKIVQRRTGWLLANPLLIAAGLCVAVLLLLDIPYGDFSRGADVLNWLLGPVTALLALGIYNQRAVLKRYFLPVLLGCLAGSLVSMGSVLLLCRLLGVDGTVAASLLPKSCTTPIALSIAESRGGLGAITACAVIFTGILGAVGAPVMLRWLGIHDPVAQGLAIGACSHAIGTSRARELGELQGAMSSIAIGVCGLMSVALSLLLP